MLRNAAVAPRAESASVRIGKSSRFDGPCSQSVSPAVCVPPIIFSSGPGESCSPDKLECSQRVVASRGVTSISSYQNEANSPAPVGGWIDSDSGIARDVNVTNMSRSQVVMVMRRSLSANVVMIP